MIRTERAGELRTITIDRPERRNALTAADLGALENAVDAATEPVVYLTGAGEAFCAGADLDTVRELDGSAARQFAAHGQRVATAIESYDGVVVAGIDGPARGGGVELALACDLRIGTPDATVGEPGVSIGLFGAWGGTARLPEIVGEGAALDIALTGRVLDASEAKELGLMTQVIDEPRSVAQSLLENSTAAMQTVKRLIRTRESQPRQESREADAFANLIEDVSIDR